MKRALFCLGLGLLLVFGEASVRLRRSAGREGTGRNEKNVGFNRVESGGIGGAGSSGASSGSSSNLGAGAVERIGDKLKSGVKDGLEGIHKDVGDVINKFRSVGNEGRGLVSNRRNEKLITSKSDRGKSGRFVVSGTSNGENGGYGAGASYDSKTGSGNGAGFSGNFDISGGAGGGSSRKSERGSNIKNTQTQENGSEGQRENAEASGNGPFSTSVSSGENSGSNKVSRSQNMGKDSTYGGRSGSSGNENTGASTGANNGNKRDSQDGHGGKNAGELGMTMLWTCYGSNVNSGLNNSKASSNKGLSGNGHNGGNNNGGGSVSNSGVGKVDGTNSGATDSSASPEHGSKKNIDDKGTGQEINKSLASGEHKNGAGESSGSGHGANGNNSSGSGHISESDTDKKTGSNEQSSDYVDSNNEETANVGYGGISSGQGFGDEGKAQGCCWIGAGSKYGDIASINANVMGKK